MILGGTAAKGSTVNDAYNLIIRIAIKILSHSPYPVVAAGFNKHPIVLAFLNLGSRNLNLSSKVTVLHLCRDVFGGKSFVNLTVLIQPLNFYLDLFHVIKMGSGQGQDIGVQVAAELICLRGVGGQGYGRLQVLAVNLLYRQILFSLYCAVTVPGVAHNVENIVFLGIEIAFNLGSATEMTVFRHNKASAVLN